MFRKMVEDDLKTILILEKELFSLPWKEEDYLYELNDNEFSHLYVLEDENEIVAYAGIWILFDQAQITTIGTRIVNQGKGFGYKMMDKLKSIAIKNQCEVITLEVRVSNEKAINLYKKCGYEIVGTRKSYYSDNHEDAYLMMKGI
ncbi:MAG: ribosomal protein S18-alanine N-acetyltransferase [Erysipelotrichaceae bacterium]